MFSIPFAMRDDRRRARFVAWFLQTYKEDSAFARARFMADSARRGDPAYTKGRVSQLFDERQPFGERAAASLAQRFGLPADYFERDDGPVARPASGLAPPPLPPADFRDRHVVSETDWGILQDVKMALSDRELTEIHTRAALIRSHVENLVRQRLREAGSTPLVVEENSTEARTETSLYADPPGLPEETLGGRSHWGALDEAVDRPAPPPPPTKRLKRI